MAQKAHNSLAIKTVKPTVFFIGVKEELLQVVDISIENKEGSTEASVEIKIGSQKRHMDIGIVESGEGIYQVYVPDIHKPILMEFILLVHGKVQDRYSVTWEPQRHWQVYLVHYSHHDIGYTDLPSNVLAEHDDFMDEILRFCKKTDSFPDESKFRYTIEQSCSISHFIKNRPKKVVDELIDYIKKGRIEVTALFGNQTTELCGHEELIRLLYPSFQLKREYNIPICSAMHNDIPGVSWGLATVLAGAGVKFFSPGIPVWYFGKKVPPSTRTLSISSKQEVHPFWDESKVLPLDIPGAFKWEGPDGSQVIFWYNLHGHGELYLWSYQQVLEELPERLYLLEKRNFPFEFVNYTIRGGERDNSPPSIELSYIVKEWNSKWAYPKLILATNQDLLEPLEKYQYSFPVFRGELSNTDYTIGALCAAKETGINRITHDTLHSAEKFATIAAIVSDYPYPKKSIDNAYENSFYYDMHCLGLHHPVGPAQDGNWSGKSNFAYKAAALSHDLLSKSLNRVVDEVELHNEGYHIVVFNSLSFKRTDIVNLPLKEHSPCGFPMYLEHSRDWSYSKLVPGTAIGRNIINPPVELIEKGFDLIDLDTGDKVPYQIVKLESPQDPVPYAPERYALGQSNRSELLEVVFVAKNVPPMGYKTYRLVPSEKGEVFSSNISTGKATLENRFFKITLNPETGTVESIYDKELQREIVDEKISHRFNQLIARWAKNGKEKYPENVVIREGKKGPIYGSIIVSGKVIGCPQTIQEIILYNKIKRIDLKNRILRDSTPLLEIYFAFPFSVENPRFRFEGANSVIEPLKDQFPGSNSDYYAMQHWADIFNEEMGVIFSSMEAPVIEFGGLWPGYVSGAHHCITPPGYGHEFKKSGEFTKGYVYSYVMNNNFRTNFKNVQVSDLLFRYSITTHRGNWKKGKAHDFGWAFQNPLIPVCINGKKKGTLPNSYSFCRVDRPNVLLLTLKQAEGGEELIVRLIETQGEDTLVTLTLPFLAIRMAYQTNLVEETERLLSSKKHVVVAPVKAFGITTLRIQAL